MIQPTAPKIEQLLDLAVQRQKSLSANLANMDTPGYRATDLSFQEEFSNIAVKTTNKGHMEPPGNSGVRRFEVQSTVKPNGNDVSLDRELTELGKNGVQYLTLVQFLNQKLRTLRASITEGGRT
jgi:flagellar basal-body rod protein FlgB